MSDSKLEAIFHMQDQFNDRIENKYDIDWSQEKWVQQVCKAIRHELVEVENELPWKWWKDKDSIDINALKEEAIDVFIFTIILCSKVGLNPDSVMKGYQSKLEENYKRQDWIKGSS